MNRVSGFAFEVVALTLSESPAHNSGAANRGVLFGDGRKSRRSRWMFCITKR
jgi:hypothetical protein